MMENSSSLSDCSVEDVICLTSAAIFQKHRPMKHFDIISGKIDFARTVASNEII